ncbi:MAG: NAD-dependent epimerase/dehydratase family protein [Syntrophaceae bacterium]
MRDAKRRQKMLVTGGTGFIGSALVRRLLREGYNVRIFDNDSRGLSSRLDEISADIEWVRADIRDEAAVRAACRGVDSVCHLAFLNGTEYFYSRPDLVLEIGVKGIVHVIDGCMKEGVRELLLASSSEVYQTPPTTPTDEKVPLSIPDPLNPRYSYAAGKIISEIMAINYGRKHFDRVVIFRPHNVYGPDMGWEHVIPQFALRMKELCDQAGGAHLPFPIQGNGHETRSFIFIDDFAEGFMRLVEKGSHLEIYNIGTMEEITIGQLAVKMGAFWGKSVSVVPGEPARGGTVRRCPDIEKLKSLGFVPRIPLDEGLRRTVRWYAENVHKKPTEKRA